MKIQNTLKMVLVFFLATVFVLMGCSNGEENSMLDNPYFQFHPLPDIYQEMIDEGLAVSWLNVSTMETLNLSRDQQFMYHDIQLDNFDAELGAIVSNVSPDDREFMIRIFLNYEEVGFRVLGKEDYVNEFTFSVPAKHELYIPFVVDTSKMNENETHRLSVVQIVEPSLHAVDIEHLFWPNRVFLQVVPIDLTIGTPSEIRLARTHDDIDIRRQENRREGFNVFPADYDEFIIDEFLRVTSSEAIKLNYVKPSFDSINWEGEDEPLEELILSAYILIAMLNGQPIEINGNPYLFINVDEHDYYSFTDFGSFTITAPTEPGSYDLIVIAFPNPTMILTDENMSIPIESVRFTIEVE